MSRKSHYLAIRPFGDSLISLSLLHQLPPTVEVGILGTPIVESVAAVTSQQRFPIRRVLPDVAAFFDLRVKGPTRALGDLMRLRRFLAQHVGPDEPLLVEQKDWRNRLVVPAGHGRPIEPTVGFSVYNDRRALIEGHFGTQLTLRQSALAERPIRSMLLHPGARQRSRAFPGSVVGHVIDYARRREIRVSLVDPAGGYSAFASAVAEYHRAPSLEAAITQLRATDLFVGADSFFLHLAYFYSVPLFCIANTARPYFSPPGMIEQRAVMSIARASDRDALSAALDALLP